MIGVLGRRHTALEDGQVGSCPLHGGGRPSFFPRGRNEITDSHCRQRKPVLSTEHSKPKKANP
jgi:hypothetical protein